MNKYNTYINTILAGSLLFASCGSKKPDATAMGAAPIPVNLYTVTKQPAVYYDEFPGNVVAQSQVDLFAEVGGYITNIYFKEGERVRKGQKLYEIDRSRYQATYEQAAAQLKVAQANQAQAQKDADRYTYLNEHDAVAKQALDYSLTTLQNSKSQVTAAKQALVRAQTDLRYATITAPFEGTIGLSQVKLGTLVNAGQTLLNTISTDDPMAVDFMVNEKEVNRFIELKNIKTKPSDSLFTIMLPGGTEYTYPGNLSVIDRGVDPQTGTIKIRLTFPNKEGILRAGMSCIVRVHNQDVTPQLQIPSKAIVDQMGERFVYTVKDSVVENGKEGRKTSLVSDQKRVTLGNTVGANVIVKEGLTEGDKIIVDGLQKMRNGAAVKPADKPATAAQATH